MPFYDDTGVEISGKGKNPLWSAFSIVADQLERLVVLNVAWAIQLIPGLVAFGWTDIPAPLRAILIGYTLIAFAPATVILYGMTRAAAHGEPLYPHTALDLLKAQGVKGLTAFMPLIGGIGALILGSSVANTLISALCQLGLLLAFVCGNYWGTLVADRQLHNPLHLLTESVRLVWRFPAQALVLAGAVIIALVIGTISIGGLFLIVPVVIALLQTQMYRSITEKKAYGTT
ncbi:MAG: hypothetical protein IAE80_27860 [Anaerolinea sp.]|mgnify:CR=1 FL=1|nr:hypothetical protein [Anaerolinea sp.]